jgi:DMSO/TMAO reductase YedYZ molybdopterin-dependent catalytic subunit
MTLNRILCAAVLVLWSAAGWSAETAPAGPGDSAVAVTGLVAAPETLTRSVLEGFPRETVTVTFMTGHGQQTGTYTGARLWDVLSAAKIVEDGKNSLLRRTLTIEGRDGYAIVIGLSEIDPDYGNHDALIAYRRDGADAPLQGFRLVMPGDKHGGRAVSDVAKIEVR